jgi:hypothetical protein
LSKLSVLLSIRTPAEVKGGRMGTPDSTKPTGSRPVVMMNPRTGQALP